MKNSHKAVAGALLCLASSLAIAAQGSDTVLADVDGDGSADTIDQCPGTAAGTLVDLRGCPAVIPALPADEAPAAFSPEAAPMGVQPPASPAASPEPAPIVAAPPPVAEPAPIVAAPPPVVAPAPIVVAPPPVAVPAPLLRRISFDAGSAKLTPEGRRVLDGVLAMMKAQPGLQLSLIGHSDAAGGESNNLSWARADAARRFLVDLGVSASRLQAVGRGAGEPLTDNPSEEGRALNRRVEFKVTAQ